VTVKGKHVLVTGATSGVGRAAAHALLARGAALTLLCRDPTRAELVAEEVCNKGGTRPELLIADLGNLDSVRRAAAKFMDSGRPLDILLNNAGLINTTRRETVDGFEETFAVNHLGPFLLTGLLLPRLLQSAQARIVCVASDAHQFCRGMQFEDLQSQQSYKTFNVYGRSKLANILFTRELARRLQGQVTVNCLHPGAVASNMGKNNAGILGKLLPLLLKPFFRSPQKGAETAVYLCADDEVAAVSGKYFIDCKQTRPKPWAEDDTAAEKLWEISEQLTDIIYPNREGATHGL